MTATVSKTAVKPTQKKQKPDVSPIHKNDALWGWIFILPCLLGLFIFTYLPTFASFGLSFSYWDLLGTPHWVGIENYIDVLNSPLFWKAFNNTVLFVFVSAILDISIGLGLAVALNRAIGGLGALRAAYFLPFVTPLVGVAIVWGWIYDPATGLFNWLIEWSHVFDVFNNGQPIAWLYDERTAMGAIIALRSWKNVGYNMILFLAGLQAIPGSVYESAQIDGASPWRTFWAITLPMITPTLFFVLMVTIINAFQAFDSIYLLTQGGPSHSTDVLVYWLFKNAFEFYKIGPASAIAYILFCVILALTGAQWAMRKRWVLNES